MPLKLYHAPNSRSLRVLWALEEMRIPYEAVSVPFPPRVHQPDYLKINPAGTLPAIVDGNRVLTESVAICEYLAGRYNGQAFIVAPSTSEHSEYLRWLWFGEATLAPPLGTIARIGRLGAAASGAGPVLEDARSSFAARALALESRLDGRDHLVDGRLTLADISCGYSLHLATVLGVGALMRPRCTAYLERLRGRPAFARAAAVR